MSARDTGGPAFPVIGAPGAPEDYPGMWLRDYFAAKAMPALIGNPELADQLAAMFNNDKAEGMGLVAQFAYQLADAMLAARGDA